MTLRVRFPHDQFAVVLKSGCEVSCGGKPVGSIRSLDLEEMKDPDSGSQRLYTVITFAVDSRLGLRKDCKVYPEGLLLGGPGKLVIGDRGNGEPIDPAQMIEGQTGASIADLTRALAAQLDPKEPASLMAMVKSQLDAADPRSLLGKIHASLNDVNTVTQSISNEFDAQEKAALLAKLHAIMDNINDATRLLREEIDQTLDRTMVAKLHDMLDTLNRGLETVVGMVEENRGPLTETVGHVRDTSRILEEQIAAAIAKQLDPADAASLIAKVHVAVERLGGSLEDIRAVTAATREVVVLNKESLDRMIANFRETSDHLKGASKDIRRNPWRLLYQPTVAEAEQANVFDAARAFADAAARLDDAAVRLQVVADSQSSNVKPTDEQLVDIREQLQRTFDDFTKVEAALWDQLKIK